MFIQIDTETVFTFPAQRTTATTTNATTSQAIEKAFVRRVMTIPMLLFVSFGF
jgi:hypothetical protein